jgi:hypothetical protein
VFVAPASAGCGCEKPPPLPAPIRPGVTYPGAEVTVFSSLLVAGDTYTVIFDSGTAPVRASVSARAVSRRDLGDGVVKTQLPVAVPPLPPGPAAISVEFDGTRLVSISDAAFTVAPAPVAVPADRTASVLAGYGAAVSRAGIVYVSLDLSQVRSPLVIRAQLRGYPLRFDAAETLFYNTQGFLMQALDGAMPGLFTLSESHDPADSDVLQYSRHEFNTFFLQHAERQAHALSADDPNWHLDGTRHIDHDHLILALSATLADGTAPEPGQTPPADLAIDTFSIFSGGLTAVGDVTMSNAAFTTSYDSRSLAAGHSGDVLSGGNLSMSSGARVDGTAVAATFAFDATAAVTGDMLVCSAPPSTMPVQIPAGLVDLGQIVLRMGKSFALVGPGSFRVADINLMRESRLRVDNANGPVTLYVTGRVTVATDAEVIAADPDPEKFAVYVVGKGPVNLARSSAFAGVVYAPAASIELSQGGVFYGSFVGGTVQVSGGSGVVYDVALRGSSGPLWPANTKPYVAPTDGVGAKYRTNTVK